MVYENICKKSKYCIAIQAHDCMMQSFNWKGFCLDKYTAKQIPTLLYALKWSVEINNTQSHSVKEMTTKVTARTGSDYPITSGYNKTRMWSTAAAQCHDMI